MQNLSAKKEFEKNLAAIKKNIADACARAGRNTAEVKLLAATKGRPAGQIRSAISAGIKIFGQNYLQEAEKTICEIGKSVEWHFIGHLQGNKAKKAVQLFDCIQTVDSLKLAKKINDAANAPFPVFLEINIAGEKNKFGIMPENIQSFYTEIKKLPNLDIRGLMCMAPFVLAEQTRQFFQKMSFLAKQLGLKELSMGMSNDYIVAVEAGSTMVRICAALFGKND